MSGRLDELDACPTCRHCGLSITLHEGIGGQQWRDNSHHSPSVCFKARNLVHEPEPQVSGLVQFEAPSVEHTLVGEIGRQGCACGWKPALGDSVLRAFDKHLLDQSTSPAGGEV